MAIAMPESPAAPEAAPPVNDPGIDLDWLAGKIDYRLFQDCVHCGLCTASCPTYVETGDENDSPRGRIYLMRAVADGRLALGPEVRQHLDLCLDCRACEIACPSGVQYGKIIEPFKVALQRVAPPAEQGEPAPAADPPSPVPLRRPRQGGARAGAPAPEARAARPRRAGRADQAPAADPPADAGDAAERSGRPGTPARSPAADRPEAGAGGALPRLRGRRHVPRDQRRDRPRLQQNGCEVVVPRGQVCCGAIHYHSGVEAPALALRPREPRGVRPRRRSTRSSSTPPAAAPCSRTTPTSCPGPEHDAAPSGSSPRSRTSPNSSSPSARSRPRHAAADEGRPITTPATSATASRSARSPGSCSR